MSYGSSINITQRKRAPNIREYRDCLKLQKVTTLEAIFLEKNYKKDNTQMEALNFIFWHVCSEAEFKSWRQWGIQFSPQSSASSQKKAGSKSSLPDQLLPASQSQGQHLIQIFCFKVNWKSSFKNSMRHFANLIRLLWDAHGHTEYHEPDLGRQEVGVRVKKSTCELPSSGKLSFDGSQWDKG